MHNHQVPHSDITVSIIKIGMIEDNKKVRDSVITYLSYHKDMNVMHSYGSAESYLEYISKNPEFKLDILLLDIGLPGITGLQAIKKILSFQPDLDIIMFTTYEEENKIIQAMCNGAVAYVSKRSSLESILEAIRVVSNGGSYMSPMIAREVFNVMLRNDQNKKEILTARQLEIIKLLVDRKSYSEIAEELFLSVDTIKSHIKKLYKTLNVKSKSEAIAKYLSISS